MGDIKPKDEVGGKNIKEQNTIEKKSLFLTDLDFVVQRRC